MSSSHVPTTPSSALSGLCTWMASRSLADADRMSMAEFEKELRMRTAAVEREATAAELARYDLDVPAVDVGGIVHRRVLRCPATYLTLGGEVVIERSLYTHRSADSEAICPMELRAGIIEGFWTPAAAFVVAHTTPGEAAEFFALMGRMSPSRSSLDRLPKGLGERWEERREEFENQLRVGMHVPEQAVAVAVSLDGVLVPMKDGERAAKRAATMARGRPAKGPAGYKEAGCATISFYDADGARISTIQFARMPETRKVTLKEMIRGELDLILTGRPDLVVVKVSDAAADNWTFLTKLAPHGEEVIDFYHAAQHIGAAVDAAYGEGSVAARERASELRHRLLEPDGAPRVLRALRYLRDEHPRSAIIARETEFFRKHQKRMHYAELVARNLPIGSGVVEAACKTLVGQRLKRSGMRWRHSGGQAILTLRSLARSGRFERGWSLLADTYVQDVVPANNVVHFKPRMAVSG